MRTGLLLFILYFLLVQAAVAQGTTYKVTDGDTANFYTSDGWVKCRLANIDAPELKQAYGKEAKVGLENALAGAEKIGIRLIKKDFYKRWLCQIDVIYQDFELNVNEFLVEQGYAWAYKSDKLYREQQAKAKDLQRGLWANSEAIAPWDYRKKKK